LKFDLILIVKEINYINKYQQKNQKSKIDFNWSIEI